MCLKFNVALIIDLVSVELGNIMILTEQSLKQ